jgi:hypothetical protein
MKMSSNRLNRSQNILAASGVGAVNVQFTPSWLNRPLPVTPNSFPIRTIRDKTVFANVFDHSGSAYW